MPLPLLLTDDEHIPIYLQLVHQIRYLITGRELVAGAQLPPVRDLAAQLGINSGTVALAYRTLQHDGLVEGQRGKGTFVARLATESTRTDLRQALLTEALEGLITRAYALGFDATAIRQQLSTNLQRQLRHVPLVLVMPSMAASEKYLGLVKQQLPSSVVPAVHATAIDLLEAGDPATLDAYRAAYFTITFGGMVPRVDAALRRHAIRSDIIGLTAQLTEAAKRKLKALAPRARHVLVTEARNVGSALTLLAQYSPLAVRELPVLTEQSSHEQFAREAATTHIYTFGVTALLDEHAVPLDKRLELEFSLSDEAAHQLSAMLDHSRLGAPAQGDQNP